MTKVTGELYDLYFLLKRDEAETAALMAEKSYYLSQAEIDERYQHMIELQQREQAQLWNAISERYGLEPGYRYLLTREGEIIQLERLEAVA